MNPDDLRSRYGRPLFRGGLIRLGERDGWKCHICGLRVPAVLDPELPEAPTRDHVIPRKRGGMAGGRGGTNLRLAHRWCNSRRGHADVGQLNRAEMAARMLAMCDPRGVNLRWPEEDYDAPHAGWAGGLGG